MLVCFITTSDNLSEIEDFWHNKKEPQALCLQPFAKDKLPFPAYALLFLNSVKTPFLLRPRGLEPLAFGLGNRCCKNAKPAKTKTCKSTKEQLTPQLTPKSQKQGKIDISKLPSDLAEIVAVWPDLPEHIKAAIKALVQTHKGTK